MRRSLVAAALLLVLVIPAVSAADSSAACQLTPEFAALRDEVGRDQVGECVSPEWHSERTGDRVQRTTHGLMTRSTVGDWTAFTDGTHTWVSTAGALEVRTGTAIPTPQSNQPAPLVGTLVITWGDPPRGSGMPPLQDVSIVDSTGRRTPVSLSQAAAAAAGGLRSLDRRLVRAVPTVDIASPAASGTPQSPVAIDRIEALESPMPMAGPSAPEAGVSGARPFVTLRCRFADSGPLPTDGPQFFAAMFGATYPGLANYWQQTSFGTVGIGVSPVLGWYTLPRPMSSYVPSASATTIDWDGLATDCTAAADADVYFPSYTGINLLFDRSIGCCSWGGVDWLSRDGAAGFWGVTWMSLGGWHSQSALAHEMGHTFGLPHSSGPYQYTYDSPWDVMSGGGACRVYDPSYGCPGVHTIAFHKALLGWIPGGQSFTPVRPSITTIRIDELDRPASPGAYLMAQLNVPGSSTQFYTVESRRWSGYDVNVPGEAAIIHQVDLTRSDRVAQVVDSDGNGNVSDTGARWTPGETFTDPVNQLSVQVLSADATGARVRISAGVSAPPIPTCSPRPRVNVSATPGARGYLNVAVAATDAGAVIESVQFGSASNALIDIGTTAGAQGNFTTTLQVASAQVQFTVRRRAAGAATTVPFTVTDSCGTWQSFVGGGSDAF